MAIHLVIQMVFDNIVDNILSNIIYSWYLLIKRDRDWISLLNSLFSIVPWLVGKTKTPTVKKSLSETKQDFGHS